MSDGGFVQRDQPLRALGYMSLAAGAFTVMNALARGMGGVPWPSLALSRAVIGLVVALAVARWRGATLRVRDQGVMWRRSLFGSAGMLCTFYALTHMPLSTATTLLNTTPLWIALAARVTLGERVGRAVGASLALAFAGVVLIERPGMVSGDPAGLVALLASAASAMAMVSLRRLSGESPEGVVVHFSAVATGVMALATGLWWATEGAPRWPHGGELAGVVAMGLAATAGQLALTRAYTLDRAARVGAAGWLQVVLAIGVDAAVFAHVPGPWAAAGIALVLLAGVALVVDARRDALSRAG